MFADWHMLQTNFLKDLDDAGFAPELFDIVLCTHHHPGPVGWNTMLVNDTWVPTFPNARYLIVRTEFDCVNDEQETEDVEPWLKDLNLNLLSDSIKPVLGAGLIDLVSNDHHVCDEIKLIPTPGYTIGHIGKNFIQRS